MPAVTTAKEELIRAKAHALWLDEGRPEGRAEIHWFRAIELVSPDAEAVSEKPPAKPKRRTSARKNS